MKTFKFLGLAVGLFIIQFSALAQVPVDGSEILLDKLRLNKGIKGDEAMLYANITGDPYLFKDYQKGVLVVSSGTKFNVNVRYDIYANEIHLKDKEAEYAIIHPEKVKSIEVDGLKFIYSPYVKSGSETVTKDGGYFIVKTDGPCKLLIRKNLRIQDPEPAKLYQEAKPAKFIHLDDTYYIKLNDQSAVRVRTEKDLLTALADQKAPLSKFIKSNRLGTKDVEDLSKIVTFYNEGMKK